MKEEEGKHEDQSDQDESRGTAVDRHSAERAPTPGPEGAIHVLKAQNKQRKEENLR